MDPFFNNVNKSFKVLIERNIACFQGIFFNLVFGLNWSTKLKNRIKQMPLYKVVEINQQRKTVKLNDEICSIIMKTSGTESSQSGRGPPPSDIGQRVSHGLQVGQCQIRRR